METPASQFFTRQRANDGVEVPLVRPDGTLSDQKLWIRGIDSDAFRAAILAQKRKYAELAAEKGQDALKFINESEDQLEVLASLVFKWTFPEACTTEAVKEFLREAPQIADAINKLSARRTFFFKQSLSNSTGSPDQSSS